MNITKQKKELCEWIDSIEDESLIETLQSIRESNQGSDIWASPEIKQAWMEEIARRDSQPLSEDTPGEEVMRKAREIIEG